MATVGISETVKHQRYSLRVDMKLDRRSQSSSNAGIIQAKSLARRVSPDRRARRNTKSSPSPSPSPELRARSRCRC